MLVCCACLILSAPKSRDSLRLRRRFVPLPCRIARFFKAPTCAISSAKKIASERRFSLRLKGTNLIPTAEFPAIPESAAKIASEPRCAILVHSGLIFCTVVSTRRPFAKHVHCIEASRVSLFPNQVRLHGHLRECHAYRKWVYCCSSRKLRKNFPVGNHSFNLCIPGSFMSTESQKALSRGMEITFKLGPPLPQLSQSWRRKCSENAGKPPSQVNTVFLRRRSTPKKIVFLEKSEASQVRGPQMGGQIRRGRIWRFWGAPVFSPQVPKYLFLKGLRTSGRKIGAPQKRQIQPRRIWPPICGPLKKGLAGGGWRLIGPQMQHQNCVHLLLREEWERGCSKDAWISGTGRIQSHQPPLSKKDPFSKPLFRRGLFRKVHSSKDRRDFRKSREPPERGKQRPLSL